MQTAVLCMDTMSFVANRDANLSTGDPSAATDTLGRFREEAFSADEEDR